MQGDWLEPFRKLAHTLGSVVADDVATGTRNGQLVKQLEERGVQGIKKTADFALRVLLRVRPLREVGLRVLHCLGDAVDIKGFMKCLIVVLSDKEKLVPEILEAVVHGCGRKQKHLGVNAGPEDLLHQELIARDLARAVIFGLPARVVAEIVRFINDDEIIIAPVVGVVGTPPQIGMRQHGIGKAISQKRIACIVFTIDFPVVFQLLWAKNQHAAIEKLEVLDNRKGFKGLPQSYAIGDDASLVLENFVDRSLYAILLKVVEHGPDLGLEESRLLIKKAATFGLGEILFKDVEQRFVVDEFRRVVLI